jgi:cell division protein FtsZ
VLSGRRETNGRATVSAGHSAAPGYQAAAVADVPNDADSSHNGRNGHAPAPAGPGSAEAGGASQAGAAGPPENGGAADPAPAATSAAATPAAAAPATSAVEPDPSSSVPPSRLDPIAAARVFDAASTRRRAVVFEEDDELDVPDFLK